MKMKKRLINISMVLLICALSSCSINKMAVNAVSDALTAPGSNTVFTGDNDPQLVGDSIPFAIKMYESLLAQNPDHEGLIEMTGSLFVMYANAFVQGPADMLPSSAYREKEEALLRAKNLYLRGAKILEGGLDKKYPKLSTSKDDELKTYLPDLEKADVASIYWYVAANLSAYGIDPFNLALGQKIPQLKILIDRAYELDPDFNSGALNEFYLLYYSSLPPAMGGNMALAEEHFLLALEKSKGLSAGPYVSAASSICIPAQDYPRFKEYLNKALEIDVDANPENRLVNIISQKKAAYLLDIAYTKFIDLGEDAYLYEEDENFYEDY
jgi:predicted anti-sigma-YlaC factor YlaD